MSYLSKKNIIELVCIVFIFLILAMPLLVSAGDDNSIIGRMKNAAQGGGYDVEGDDTKLATTAGIIIGAFLSLLGIVFIILILLAGFHWMTAQGDESKVTQAKGELRHAIIGLIIVVGAYAIWDFIWSFLV